MGLFRKRSNANNTDTQAPLDLQSQDSMNEQGSIANVNSSFEELLANIPDDDADFEPFNADDFDDIAEPSYETSYEKANAIESVEDTFESAGDSFESVGDSFESSTDADEVYDTYSDTDEDTLTDTDATDESENTSQETPSYSQSKKKQGKNKRYLYILTDRPQAYLMEYLRMCGVKVSRIYTDIKTLHDDLMLNFDKIHIVIIDSGTGKMVNPVERTAYKDLISLATDGTYTFEVHYTDPLLYSITKDIISSDIKQIGWYHYSGTINYAAALLRLQKHIVYEDDSLENQSLSMPTLSEEEANNLLGRKGSEVPMEDLDKLKDKYPLSFDLSEYLSKRDMPDYTGIRPFNIRI